MPFEWDENKCKSNLAKHGIDFRDAERFFNAETICFEDWRQDNNEKRFIAFGKIEERLIITVYATG